VTPKALKEMLEKNCNVAKVVNQNEVKIQLLHR